MKIYMSVTADKYELPVHVSSNVHELAKIYDINARDIWSAISRGNINRKDNVKFVRVEVDDE